MKNILRIFFILIFGLTLTYSSIAQIERGTTDFRRIYVARHGQRPSGGDPMLTKLGVIQAQKLAQYIKVIGFDGKIYASPYLRTIETAAQLAKVLNKQIILCPEFQERTHKMGTPDVKGYTQEELTMRFPTLISPTPALKYPWVYADNSGEILQKRVENEIKRILATTKEDIAIFTHKAVVEAAIKYLSTQAGVKLDFTVWNCMLVYFIVDARGNIKYVGSTIGFLPPNDVTNNFKAGLLQYESTNK